MYCANMRKLLQNTAFCHIFYCSQGNYWFVFRLCAQIVPNTSICVCYFQVISSLICCLVQIWGKFFTKLNFVAFFYCFQTNFWLRFWLSASKCTKHNLLRLCSLFWRNLSINLPCANLRKNFENIEFCDIFYCSQTYYWFISKLFASKYTKHSLLRLGLLFSSNLSINLLP